ncbi:ComEA family DNA-binding protein [Edaphocola aurantiacus]|uniref:ComEA family DNA-binding protein n=1 Tax=Edaphocola aurantiacus TaxID=2601682 RepID=UPI001C95AC86|nr:helix-hairpin-helix domain-containing protein [Edaphocola aurantiacus]
MKKKQPQPALSKSQVKGIIVLGILLLGTTLFWRLSSVFENHETKLPVSDTGSYTVTDPKPYDNNKENAWDESADRISTPAPNTVLFPFNPNTASEQDFIRLGLPEKVARTICKYRSKGGRFYDKEDFAKIYTLSEADYKRLLPYISIPQEPGAQRKYAYNNNKHTYPNYRPDSSQSYHPYPRKQNKPILINTCTAEELMSLRGIGTGYAGRIINYRETLGGFVAKEQLKEVYGMSDSLYMAIEPYIIIEESAVRKISLNNATEAEWLQHPYTRKMTKYILLYHKDIGSFKQIEDFRKVPLINDEKYRKIAPYLSL